MTLGLIDEGKTARPMKPRTKNDALDFEISVPLVIDLDLTLISTDALHESLIMFLKRHPLEAWNIPLWLLQGRAVLKRQLAQAVTDADAHGFPINADILTIAQREAALGRRVFLATGADISIAQKMQRRL